MISNIRLQNFRSYNDQSFEFEDGVNIVVGPNASGKTNLLEAILVLCRGRSFRAKDSGLVMFDKPWARIDSYIGEHNEVVTIKESNGVTTKEFIINKVPHKKLPKQFSYPVVLFEPNNLLLLHGSPEGRREYLDDIIEYQKPGYAQTRKSYARILAQRNRLLKSGVDASGQMFVWNLRLSEFGEIIANERLKLVEKLNSNVSKIYSEIAGDKYKVNLSYKTKCNQTQYGSSMLSRLEAEARVDLLRGFTGCGPHRDDVEVSIDGNTLTSSASRGETRTLLLALKILELHIVEELTNKKPILLLDDVFSELDGKRRSMLTRHVQDYQAFITTTDADTVAKSFTTKCNLIAF